MSLQVHAVDLATVPLEERVGHVPQGNRVLAGLTVDLVARSTHRADVGATGMASGCQHFADVNVEVCREAARRHAHAADAALRWWRGCRLNRRLLLEQGHVGHPLSLTLLVTSHRSQGDEGLDFLGEQGWELVTSTPHTTTLQTYFSPASGSFAE